MENLKFIEKFIDDNLDRSENQKYGYMKNDIYNNTEEIVILLNKSVSTFSEIAIFWRQSNSVYNKFEDFWPSLTKKNPKIKDITQKIIYNSFKSPDKLKYNYSDNFLNKHKVRLFNRFVSNKQWLKKYANIYDFSQLNYEEANDKIENYYQIEKVNSFIKNNFSLKYQKLINQEAKDNLKTILNKDDITVSYFKDAFVKKSAMYKTEQDFVKGLKQFLFFNSNWNPKAIKDKIKNTNSTIVLDEDDKRIVVKVKDQADSTELGSNQWCISNAMAMFNKYVNNGNKQYFIYDFSKEESDPLSMVGITVDRYNKCLEVQDKNNKDIKILYLKKHPLESLNIKTKQNNCISEVPHLNRRL